MKKFLFLLLSISFIGSNVFAQCPFNLGPDATICAGTPFVLNGPGGPVISYQWSTGETTASILVTSPGIYWLSVTDSASNTCSDSIFINFSPPMNISLTCLNNSCTVCTNGSITATVLGGGPPFNYLWSNGANIGFINNLGAGTYTVTVTDVWGCTISSSCTIITGPIGTGSNLVSGNVFFDTDSNGIKGTGEPGVPYVKTSMAPDGLVSYTDTSGNYAFLTDTGTHVVDFIPVQGLTLTAGTGGYTIPVTSGSYPGNDFGVKGVLSGGLATTFINSGNPRCGTVVAYQINSSAYVSASSLTGYIMMITDTAVAFVNAIPTPVSISGDTVIWNFVVNQGINPLQFTCNLQLPTPAGYPFYTILQTVLSDSTGAVVFSTIDSLHQIIRCSYDPNDKSVEPEGYGPQHYVLLDYTPSLYYTIRFQNTGNDTAYSVVILDTLDQNFYLNSFTFMGSSHPVQITMLNNLVEFRFDNIYLPDSNINEPASHGWVSFKCNPIFTGSAYPLENTAAIYFDANPPVITNTTLSTLDITVGINENTNPGNRVTVFPNPFSGQASIVFENPLHDRYELSVYDLSSRLILKTTTTSNSFDVDGERLGNGLYFFNVQDKLKTRVFWDRFVVVK